MPVLNVLLRLTILYFLIEVLLNPDDPRFAAKAIGPRNLVIVLTLSLLFPVLHLWKKRWERYPWGWDNLYLSIFWFDMAGNSFNLYNSFEHFDLLPHFYGSGAVAAILYGAFGLSFIGALGLANSIHIALEAQEYYTDVFAGTRNVHGPADVVNDLVVGLVASILYPLAVRVLGWRDGRSTETPLRRGGGRGIGIP
jgi:hypothetical protein